MTATGTMFQAQDRGYVRVPPTAQIIEDVLSSRFNDGWAPWLQDFISPAAPETVKPRSYCMLPVSSSWPHCAVVTLLGNAMNLMSPFAGAGGNVAMPAGTMLGTALSEVKERPIEEVDKRLEESSARASRSPQLRLDSPGRT